MRNRTHATTLNNIIRKDKKDSYIDYHSRADAGATPIPAFIEEDKDGNKRKSRNWKKPLVSKNEKSEADSRSLGWSVPKPKD